MGRRTQLLWLDAEGLAVLGEAREIGEAADELLARMTGQAATVLVSASALHQLVADPALPLRDEATLGAYARQQFSQYFGAAALRWPLAAWISAKHRGVSALHGIDWTALSQAADAHQVFLRSARPAWSAVLPWVAAQEPELLRNERSLLAWVEGSLLCLIRFEQGHCVDVSHRRLSAATPQALATALQGDVGDVGEAGKTLVLGFGLTHGELPAPLHALDRLDRPAPLPVWFGGASIAVLPSADFLGNKARAPALSWALALTGVLTLATAAWTVWGSYRDLQDGRERMAQAQAQVSADVPRRAMLKPGDPARANMAAPDGRVAREAQQLLTEPWEAVLAEVERAGATVGVNWLGLDVQAGRQSMRLEGSAVDKASALRITAALSGAPGWRDIQLTRLQQNPDGSQRFELVGTLRPAELRAPAALGAPR
ncbi:MAG TPA: hypothetical protein VGE47_13760 [Burkholderiaceae bacterium]